MNQSQYNQLFSFLWGIANDVLVQAFEKGKYKEIIKPMPVLRLLDILLEPKKTVIGYELSFTKYFYKPVAVRSIDEIVADIRKIEAATDGLLNEILK